MATVSLSSSPVTLDSGASDNVSVSNTGSVDVVVSRGAQSFTLRPTQGRVVYPEGAAVTAVTTSGSGQVTTVATAARLSQQAQFAADPAFTGTYALRPKNRVVFLGDSIFQGSDGSSTFYQYHQDSTPLHALLASDGRWKLVWNAGIFGNRSAQMLARLSTDVLAKKAGVCVVMAGTNDAGDALPLSTYSANITAIVTQLQAAGFLPVLCLVLPTNVADTTTIASRRATVQKYNNWLRQYAARNGIALVDTFSPVVDPANGGFLASLTSDGTHPNAAGRLALGTAIATALAQLLPPIASPLLRASTDAIDMLGGIGLFSVDTNSDGTADGWTATLPTGAVASLQTVTGVAGQMQRITATSTASVAYVLKSITTGFTPGDVLEICGLTSTSGGPGVWVKLTLWGSPGPLAGPVEEVTGVAVTNGFFQEEFTVPPSTTSIDLALRVESGSGWGQWGQIRLINHTVQGTDL